MQYFYHVNKQLADLVFRVVSCVSFFECTERPKSILVPSTYAHILGFQFLSKERASLSKDIFSYRAFIDMMTMLPTGRAII